jgi:hypothetical protein
MASLGKLRHNDIKPSIPTLLDLAQWEVLRDETWKTPVCSGRFMVDQHCRTSWLHLTTLIVVRQESRGRVA